MIFANSNNLNPPKKNSINIQRKVLISIHPIADKSDHKKYKNPPISQSKFNRNSRKQGDYLFKYFQISYQYPSFYFAHEIDQLAFFIIFNLFSAGKRRKLSIFVLAELNIYMLNQ
jgi:hypothetical protein